LFPVKCVTGAEQFHGQEVMLQDTDFRGMRTDEHSASLWFEY